MSATIQSIPKVNKQIKEKKVYDLEKYILNPETGRYVKIGGKVHQKMTGELKEPKKHATIKTSENSIVNPETGKLVLIDGRAYKKFMGKQTVKPGMVKSPKTNRWIKINGKAYKKAQDEGVKFPEETQSELATENTIVSL
jgi:hypothetical protein